MFNALLSSSIIMYQPNNYRFGKPLIKSKWVLRKIQILSYRQRKNSLLKLVELFTIFAWMYTNTKYIHTIFKPDLRLII